MDHGGFLLLVFSSLVACAAIGAFPWSSAMAKVLVVASALTACIAAGNTGGIGDSGTWAFLFACAGCGGCLVGAAMIFGHLARWVDRFAIYTGYGATFAAMGAVALVLGSRGVGSTVFAVVLVGIWALGSVGIFATKTLLVRHAVKGISEDKANQTYLKFPNRAEQDAGWDSQGS
jgi:hypothetical protein